MGGRDARAMLVIGAKGSGKTYISREEFNLYVKQYVRPVLIVDVNGEYSQFKAIYYDAREKDRAKRAMGYKNSKDTGRMGIAGINQPRIYRVIGVRPDNIPMDPDELAELILTIAIYYRNGLLVLEEMNSYIRRTIPVPFYAFITNLRHRGVDVFMHYQAIGDPHPDIWRQTDSLRLHHTGESVRKIKDKISERYEVVRIAELSIEKNYLIGVPYKREHHNLEIELETCQDPGRRKQISKSMRALQPYLEKYYYYYLYMDFLYMRIECISTEDFIESYTRYLYQTKTDIRDLMEEENGDGKIYRTKTEAINKLVADKMIYIS